MILDPNPSTGKLDVQETITLDDSYSPDEFGVGVLGLKVDNVDGDVQNSLPANEIWCGDGKGHLYCLGRNPSDGDKYEAFFRSESLGPYPGIYNNIFPWKDEYGRTKYLVVVTPGYVYRFEVTGAVPW